MLYRQQPLKLGDRPVVLRADETGTRASQLMAHAGIQRVAKGLWAVHPAPLTPVERSLLLQQYLGAPGSTLAVTGFNALDILKIPAGYIDHWVHQSPDPGIFLTPDWAAADASPETDRPATAAPNSPSAGAPTATTAGRSAAGPPWRHPGHCRARVPGRRPCRVDSRRAESGRPRSRSPGSRVKRG